MEKKLKILMVVDTFYPVIGGVQVVVDKSAEALSDYAHLTVLTVKHNKFKDKKTRYKIIRCKGFYNSITGDGMGYPCFDKKTKDEINKSSYDIIHIHSPGNLFNYGIKLGKKRNIPIVTTVHNTMFDGVKSVVKFNWLAKVITKIFMKKTSSADFVWSVSNYCGEKARENGLYKPYKTMYNAVDLDLKQSKKTDIRLTHNIEKEEKIFLCVSRLVKEKNIDLILDSAKLLECEKFKIIIVGDGPYLKNLKQKAINLGIEKKFVFTGMIRERSLLCDYYNYADLILFPSVIESAGLIQVEAAGFEKPSLVIEGVATAEEIVHLKNGLTAKNDARDYASQMLYALRNDISHLGKQAKKDFYRNYKDLKYIKDVLLNEYNVCVKKFKEGDR